jgi:branched-chain amino acid transport system permease protein
VFRETSWGLAARATANDEHGAAAVGIDRRAAVFATWALSAVVATAAGGLMAQFLGAFTPHGFYFRLAFTLLAMLIVGGMSSSLGALSGVILTTALIEVARRCESGVEVFGVTMPTLFGLPEAALAVGMLLIIWRRPDGLCRGFELDVVRRLGIQQRPAAAAALLPRHPGADSVRVEALTKRFAGLTAVDNVSIDIARDAITGIIGPNGAGKTTLLNLISGHAVATSGRIWIGQTPLESAAAHIVARTGVARTFQNIRIFPRMSVFENALVAARQVEGSLRAAEQVAWREIAVLGLQDYASRPAGSLAYGLRRRLEIARALTLGPSFLLLDEPAAGMTPVETASLIEILAQTRRERGLGIVLVEHDMQLVMTLCERLIVLDQGRLIAAGTPREVQGNPAVIAAYLGSRTSAKVLGLAATHGGTSARGLSRA